MAKQRRLMTAQEFLRAGRHRLNAAETLKQCGIHLEAVYLAGYTIECSLKAVIVASAPKSKRHERMETISRGVRAHDFEYLLGLLREHRVNVPLELSRQLRLARSIWSPDLRYQTSRKDVEVVNAMFMAAIHLLQWAERSIS